ncbi:MAG: HAMP domain-containing protein [Desulfobacteraceae bacterium]|nr:HAMP domain-containing protein [Desulfobacteraceae bacterium]
MTDGIEQMHHMKFGILKKFLAGFLLLSLMPLVGLSAYTWMRMNRTVAILVDSSRDALTQNSMSLLEARAQAIAGQVEQLLSAGMDDLNMLATLPVDLKIYRDFAGAHHREIWMGAPMSDSREGVKKTIPLYNEVTFADTLGREKILIREGGSMAQGRDVSGTFQGRFGPENYFTETMAMADQAVYVSHLTGFHVPGPSGGEAVAGEAPGSLAYRGVIRFAKKVYHEGRLLGVVSLALDHRHLMEFTQHVLPFRDEKVAYPSYASGNYAFMFDDEGWMLTHPKPWDIRGFDRDGSLVDPASGQYRQALIKAGQQPFNLLHVPFVHENYQQIAREVIAGRSGVRQTASVGGISRVLAFAPIKFNHGAYRKTGCFGGVTLGAQTEAFHRTVNRTFDEIHFMLGKIAGSYFWLIFVTGIVVAGIAVWLARSFTLPIRMLIEKISDISRGKYDVDISITRGDELGILGREFSIMSHKLKQHEEHLVKSLDDLEKHVDILKSIHSAGQMFTFAFDREKVYEVILNTCVEGIGFKRAMLFIPNGKSTRLELVKAAGFDRWIEKLIYDSALEPIDISAASGNGDRTQAISHDIILDTLYERITCILGENSIALAPITIDGRLTGVLGVDVVRGKNKISEKRTKTLDIVANEAGMAIERARLMEEAVKRREFIESIFSNMLSGLIVFDKEGAILSANPRAMKFFKCSWKEMRRSNIEELLLPYPALMDLIRAERPQGEIRGAPVDLTLPGNKHIYLETSISTIQGGPRNSQASTLVIFRDMTTRKNMERHIARADKLVSLGILAAGIAHEIRNPLTGITLVLDDLHDRIPSGTGDRELIQKSLEEIEKLENIVNRLLDFASKPGHNPVMEDLNKVIDDTLFFVSKQCKRHGVELRKETAEDLPRVNIDRERIRQAILNIVLNALNVLDRGGEITITTSLVDNQEGRFVVLSIRDNGPGIAQDDLDNIFDPFFSRNPEGFGLGLSITHTIVEEHDGKIVVETEPGRGCCFKIHLPAPLIITNDTVLKDE